MEGTGNCKKAIEQVMKGNWEHKDNYNGKKNSKNPYWRH